MAGAKASFIDWRCPTCNKTTQVQKFNKRNKDKIVKEKSIFCNQCRAHTKAFRKETSSGSLGNKR